MDWTLDKIQDALKTIDASHEAKWIIAEVSSEKISSVIERRLKNEPLAYILGHWSFRDMEMFVGKGVLIPRPETEELVDFAVKYSEENFFNKDEIRIADFGAGTGCLGIGIYRELQKKFPRKKIDLYCVEKSIDALYFLCRNVDEYAPAAKVFNGSWNEFPSKNEPQKFDLIVSNPPYITSQEYAGLDKGVKDFEPISALVPVDESANTDALGPYQEIVKIADKILEPKSWLWFEMGTTQPEKIAQLATSTLAHMALEKDMSGKTRFAGFVKK